MIAVVDDALLLAAMAGAIPTELLAVHQAGDLFTTASWYYRHVWSRTDARHLPVESGSVALVFTSPPYCSALDYTRAHMFAVAWMPEVLGCSAAEYRHLGRDYVGSERAPLATATPAPRLPPPSDHDAVD